MDRRFDDRGGSMSRDDRRDDRRMESRGDYGSERYERNSGSFYDNDHRGQRDDRSGSFYDSSHRSYSGAQGRDTGFTGRRDDDRDRLGAGRDQDRYDSRGGGGDFRQSQRMISDTAGRERSDYRDERRREDFRGGEYRSNDSRSGDYRGEGSRGWSDRRDDRRTGEYNTSIFDNRDSDYPDDRRRPGSEGHGSRDDRERYRGGEGRMSQGGGGDMGYRRDDRRHDDRRHDDRRQSGDDEYQYHGRDYGFSWTDGSNDATWRQMDRWGNEYSNNARSEGYGWNRGSTRDHNFLSSPDRER
jgi:hypothetical protein